MAAARIRGRFLDACRSLPAGSVEIVNAHIVKSACLAAIAASLATSSPAWAEDVKGSKDHPALTRFEGAEIRAYEHKDFDEAVMPDRPIRAKPRPRAWSWRAS